MFKKETITTVTTGKFPIGPTGSPTDFAIFKWSDRVTLPWSHTQDLVGPTKVSEVFANLDTLGATGTGTFTMNESIMAGAVTSISFIDAVTGLDIGGTIAATGTGTSAVVSVTYTAPAVAPNDVKIKMICKDLAGNSSSIIFSSAYTLF